MDDAIARAIDDLVEEDVRNEIAEIVESLPQDIKIGSVWNLIPTISVKGSSFMVEQYRMILFGFAALFAAAKPESRLIRKLSLRISPFAAPSAKRKPILMLYN